VTLPHHFSSVLTIAAGPPDEANGGLISISQEQHLY